MGCLTLDDDGCNGDALFWGGSVFAACPAFVGFDEGADWVYLLGGIVVGGVASGPWLLYVLSIGVVLYLVWGGFPLGVDLGGVVHGLSNGGLRTWACSVSSYGASS